MWNIRYVYPKGPGIVDNNQFWNCKAAPNVTCAGKNFATDFPGHFLSCLWLRGYGGHKLSQAKAILFFLEIVTELNLELKCVLLLLEDNYNLVLVLSSWHLSSVRDF